MTYIHHSAPQDEKHVLITAHTRPPTTSLPYHRCPKEAQLSPAPPYDRHSTMSPHLARAVSCPQVFAELGTANYVSIESINGARKSVKFPAHITPQAKKKTKRSRTRRRSKPPLTMVKFSNPNHFLPPNLLGVSTSRTATTFSIRIPKRPSA